MIIKYNYTAIKLMLIITLLLAFQALPEIYIYIQNNSQNSKIVNLLMTLMSSTVVIFIFSLSSILLNAILEKLCLKGNSIYVLIAVGLTFTISYYIQGIIESGASFSARVHLLVFFATLTNVHLFKMGWYSSQSLSQ